MINESQLRERLRYDDPRPTVLSGPQLAHLARQRHAHRRVAITSVAAGLAVLAAGGGFTAWERQPRIIQSDVAYASGPTLVLPDGRVELRFNGGRGTVRAWLDSQDRICWGDDGGSVCSPPVEPHTGFAMVSSARSDGLIGGLVHRPIQTASFMTPDGQELETLVIGFEKFTDWRVVMAVVPRTDTGILPSLEKMEFSAN